MLRLAVLMVSAGGILVPLAAQAQSATAKYAQGEQYFQNGEFREAVRALTEAIKLDTTFADAYDLRADAYEELGNLPSCMDDRNMAVALRVKERTESRTWLKVIRFVIPPLLIIAWLW